MQKYLIPLLFLVLIFVFSDSLFGMEPFEVILTYSSWLNHNSKYSIKNVFDNDIKTCWAEGVASDGSGLMQDKFYGHEDKYWIRTDVSPVAEQFECMLIPFPPHNMRITRIRIYNGYGKSDVLWKANNRIKTLGIEIYGFQGEIRHNDLTHYYRYKLRVPLADKGWNDIILGDCLKDSRSVEGWVSRSLLWGLVEDRGLLEDKEGVNFVESIKFYILDTFKGSKYNDTCISEIEFYNQNEKYVINKVYVHDPESGSEGNEGIH